MIETDMKNTKRRIVCKVLGLRPTECSHGDEQYVSRFESQFGELTRENFRAHFDDAEFTAWAISEGY